MPWGFWNVKSSRRAVRVLQQPRKSGTRAGCIQHKMFSLTLVNPVKDIAEDEGLVSIAGWRLLDLRQLRWQW